MNILADLKNLFPDKPILSPSFDPESRPEDAIIVSFCKEDRCKEIKLSRSTIKVAGHLLDPQKRNVLAISDSWPTRTHIVPAGKEIKKSYHPVADWDGTNLRIAVAEKTIKDTTIKNALYSGLPELIQLTGTQNGGQILRQNMALGLDKEKSTLSKQSFRNRMTAKKLLKDAEKYLSAADRQERIMRQLEALEGAELEKHAEEQWSDIISLVPVAAESVNIDRSYIWVVTNPIVLLGVFIGRCTIQVHIKSAFVKVRATDPSTIRMGHCHPHIQDSGDPCWGNQVTEVTEMTARRDYFGLISMTLRILNQYVEEDAYTPKLKSWGKLAATLDDGPNCYKFGPTYSYGQLQNCLECQASQSGDCRYTRRDILYVCQEQHTAPECIQCKHEDCEMFVKRWDNCRDYMNYNGVSYCMLECKADCPHLADMAKTCAIQNKPEDGPCPASALCRHSCEEQ